MGCEIGCPTGHIRAIGRYVLAVALTIAAFAGIVLGCDAVFGTSSGFLGSHGLRTTACLLAVGFWIFVAVRTQQKITRNAYLASSVVLGTLTWCLLPTADGVQLWNASSRLEKLADQLDQLSSGDWQGFQETSAQAGRIVVAFGRTRHGYIASGQKMAEAEAAWVSRSVQAAIEAARELQEKVPDRARNTLGACAEALRQSTSLDMAKDRWLESRRLLLRAQLDACRWSVRPLIEADHFEEAAQLARATTTELESEAACVGEAEDLRCFREQCSYLAALARVARQPASK